MNLYILNFLRGASKAVYDPGIFSLWAARSELWGFVKAQTVIIASVAVASLLVIGVPAMLLVGFLRLVGWGENAEAVLQWFLGSERQFLWVVVRLAPFVHILVIRYVLFQKLDDCFFASLRQVLEGYNRKHAKRRRGAGVHVRTPASTTSPRGAEPIKSSPLDRQSSAQNRAAAEHAQRMLLHDDISCPLTKDTLITNVDEFVSAFQSIPPIENSLDQIAFRFARNVFGAVILFLAVSSTAYHSHLFDPRERTLVQRFIGDFGTTVMLVAQFVIVFDKLGFRRAIYSTLLVWAFPGLLRNPILWILQYFIAIAALSREVLDPPIARVKERGEDVIYYDSVTRRLEFVPRSQYLQVLQWTGMRRRGRDSDSPLEGGSGPAGSRGGERDRGAGVGGGGEGRAVEMAAVAQHSHHADGDINFPQTPPRESRVAAGRGVADAAPSSAVRRHQHEYDPTVTTSEELSASFHGGAGRTHHRSAPPWKEADRGAGGTGPGGSSTGAVAGPATTPYTTTPYPTTVSSGSPSKTEKAKAGRWWPFSSLFGGSEPDVGAHVPRMNRRWRLVRKENEALLFGFGLPIVLVIQVPLVGAMVGWFAAQGAAAEIFLNIWLMEYGELKKRRDEGT